MNHILGNPQKRNRAEIRGKIQARKRRNNQREKTIV